MERNALERMKWFLHFAELNLATLRPGDWLNLREDLWYVTHGFVPSEIDHERRKNIPLSVEELEQFTPEEVAVAQAYVHDWLKRNAWREAQDEEKLPGQPMSREEQLQRAKAPAYYVSTNPLKGRIRSVTFSADPSGFTGVAVEADDITDMLLFALLGAWCNINRFELRRCPACEKVFLIEHGRQSYCSAKCKNRAASRRFRSANSQKERTRARATYEKKVRSKLGPHVQIGSFRKRSTAQRKRVLQTPHQKRG